jgi:6-phosphogluconolactonase/glucosamine-6-phosphate isomerase/deaminase
MGAREVVTVVMRTRKAVAIQEAVESVEPPVHAFAFAISPCNTVVVDEDATQESKAKTVNVACEPLL